MKTILTWCDDCAKLVPIPHDHATTPPRMTTLDLLLALEAKLSAASALAEELRAVVRGGSKIEGKGE